MRIALGQINPVTGDLKGNCAQICRALERAAHEKADLAVFPETAISGYACGALFDQVEFVGENQRLLHEEVAPRVSRNMTAVVGFVSFDGVKKNGLPQISSAAAVIQGGKVLSVYRKILLAGENHQEDLKYFTPGDSLNLIDVEIAGSSWKLGTPVCEDAWSHSNERDIVAEMCGAGAELIVCPIQSYFFYGKQRLRREIFSAHAERNGVPVVVVNAVGVGDIVKNIIIYDGGSFVFDATGALREELPAFSETVKIADIDLGVKSKNPPLPLKAKFEEIFEALVYEQRELFRVLGLKKAQVHLSGGVDSAVAAAIVVEAMGAENTVLISNPTRDNSDLTRKLAERVAGNLGVRLYWNSTEEPYRAVLELHTRDFGEPPPAGKASMQAVLRTVQGIAASHTFGSGIVATGNHTEIVLGWASFHDIGSVGVHAPIGDLTKVEVFALAEYINQRAGREVIPRELFDGTVPPMAELDDAREDPFDYYVVSGLCAEMIRNRKSVSVLCEEFAERTLTPEFFPKNPHGKDVYELCTAEQFAVAARDVFERAKRSVFKSAQAAPTVIISPRSRGFSSRETIINLYQGSKEP